MKRGWIVPATGLAILAALFGATADAQTFPAKPIRLVIPFAAGGPTDTIARLLSGPMERALGQSLEIDIVTGEGGATGALQTAKAAPDGYTIMIGNMGTHGAAPALNASLSYDPAKDFEPVGLAASSPIVIVGRKTLDVKDLKAFIGWIKANGDKVRQAHAGNGSTTQISGQLFDSLIGAKPTLIAYTGAGPALNDLVATDLDVMCDQLINVVDEAQAGAVRAFAIAAPKRSPALPGVPTTREAGLGAFQVSAWNAVFAPKGTPKDVVGKINAALSKALDDAPTRKQLTELGATIPDRAERSPQALQKLVASETARWAKALKTDAPK